MTSDIEKRHVDCSEKTKKAVFSNSSLQKPSLPSIKILNIQIQNNTAEITNDPKYWSATYIQKYYHRNRFRCRNR